MREYLIQVEKIAEIPVQLSLVGQNETSEMRRLEDAVAECILQIASLIRRHDRRP